jgi:hypothetical protein
MTKTTSKKTLLIKAVPCRGGYCLKAENGEYPQEKFVHPSRASAYRDAAQMWAPRWPWFGRKVKGGFRIEISESIKSQNRR